MKLHLHGGSNPPISTDKVKSVRQDAFYLWLLELPRMRTDGGREGVRVGVAGKRNSARPVTRIRPSPQ
ncbi:MAG: hypothetical protein Q8Q03_00130 [bacterium]|nr:hypothetical protein [bacterium]